MELSPFLPLLAFLCACYVFHRSFLKRYQGPLPPGPKGDPLIGHLRYFLKPIDDTTYCNWRRQYGGITYFNVLGKDLIFLNTEEVARDLLEKRGSIYSDRPDFRAFQMIGWKDLLPFTHYGGTFHKSRKLFQDALSRTGVLVFQETQIHHVSTMLKSLLLFPHDSRAHLNRFTSSVMLDIAYGHKVERDNDPYLGYIEILGRAVAGAGNPGVSAVDLFPSLRYLPSWFPWPQVVRHCNLFRPAIRRSIDAPFQDVLGQVKLGVHTKCFLSRALEPLHRNGELTEEEMHRLKNLAYTFYAAGGDTTIASLETCLLALLVFPHVQRKAYEEIDEVLGTERIPTFADRERLPYLQCVVQEAIRWNPALPLGVPHRVVEDDMYNGMFIPKGATITANVRCMTMDPSVYRNPHDFCPERFLPQPEGYGEPYPTNAFGFGRRGCPGMHLAEANIWIAVATLIACFDILPCKDEGGNAVFPVPEFQSALSSRPKPFECIIRPRSPNMQALIEAL